MNSPHQSNAFFEWKIAVSSRSKYAGFNIVGNETYSDPHYCSSCGCEIASGDWLPPHNVQFDGSTFGDFTSNGSSFALSSRSTAAFSEAGITGLHISDAALQSPADSPRFFHATADPVLTVLDEKESGVEVVKVNGCHACRVLTRKRTDRLRLDMSTWQGQDVFRPSGLYGVVVVSSRLVQLVEQFQLNNFHFVHQDDFREDWSLLLGIE